MNPNKLQNKMIFTIIILSIMVFENSYATTRHPLKLRGKALGGTLILGRTGFFDMRYISIETLPGESVESVAKRMADQITSNNTNKNIHDTHKLWHRSGSVSSGTNVEVLGNLSHYFLAGTERGLGIPEPPVFLTCNYQKQTGELSIAWQNPDEGYEQIFVSFEWGHGRHFRRNSILGDSTKYVDNIPVNINDLYIAVVGFRDDLVSSPTAMHVGEHYQDESFGFPFANAIAPNWKAWGKGLEIDAKGLYKQGDAYPGPKYYIPTLTLKSKPFYQIIKASPSGPVGYLQEVSWLDTGPHLSDHCGLEHSGNACFRERLVTGYLCCT